MEQKFVAVWLANRETAARMGVRLRPVAPEDAMKTAHRWLSGIRQSDGFGILADKRHLELSLEALGVINFFFLPESQKPPWHIQLHHPLYYLSQN